MTIAQIYAILALLLAFNVPQPTVNNIQAILEKSKVPAQTTAPIIAVGAPASVASIAVDCTPTLETSVKQFEGNITTGTGYMFTATSTLPVGCQVNTSMEVDLQTPTGKYRGTIGSWMVNGGHVKLIDNGFTYYQGWGTPPGVTPKGSFIWYVGDVSSSPITL